MSSYFRPRLAKPALRGRAFAVGARAEERGVVASCSYAARYCGVRSALAMGLAQRLCPHIVVPVRHATCIDEAFLDVTELLSNASIDRSVTGGALALEIQRRIEEELGLPVLWAWPATSGYNQTLSLPSFCPKKRTLNAFSYSITHDQRDASASASFGLRKRLF